METIKILKYTSPVGDMILGSIGNKLCLCDWNIEKRRGIINRRICRRFNAIFEEGSSAIIHTTIQELNEYFAGKRKDFSIPIIFSGTEFQCQVWKELMKIPYGATLSYSQIASRIENPKAVRAVASAIADNPISIIVPCHRVVGSNGSLTGYAGGLPAKQALLTLESKADALQIHNF